MTDSIDLSAALNHKMISEAFEIARSNRTGILQVAQMQQPAVAYDGYKMGWLDFRIDATSDPVNGAVLAADTTITVTDGSKFRKGMVLSPADSEEVILVTAISGNDLTVTRGFGGTTSADIADTTELFIDSTSREENSLGETDGIFQPVDRENFFQTMDTMVEFSRRALSTMQYGGTNNITFQVQERIRQLAIQMDRALVRGRKDKATIDGKERTYTGGLRYWMEQAGAISTDNAGAALTLDQINALNAEIVSRGGTTNTIAVGISKARELQARVNANYGSQRLAEWSNDEGGLTRLPTDLPLLGSVNQIVIDTNLNDDELIIFDSNMISIKPMLQNNAGESGAWQTKDATQKGQDGQAVRVLGDFAFEIRNSETHMARLYNIA